MTPCAPPGERQSPDWCLSVMRCGVALKFPEIRPLQEQKSKIVLDKQSTSSYNTFCRVVTLPENLFRISFNLRGMPNFFLSVGRAEGK